MLSVLYYGEGMGTGLQLRMTSKSLPAFNRQCFSKTARVLNCAKIPTPPVNPKDPFPSKRASVSATKRPSNSDSLPLLDMFSPELMAAAPAQAMNPYSDTRKRRAKPKEPEDLATKLFDRRIVYIGLPFVGPVTELIIGQLIYLQWSEPEYPVYLAINSTGTTNDDGEVVALETEGFAIYDTMMFLKTEIVTGCFGVAIGQACLLLAAGTKGRRYMHPGTLAMIHQPRVPPSGLMPACDVQSRAQEAMHNRDVLIGLLAKHTGNSFETVEKLSRGGYSMDPYEAKKFGVIDKIMYEDAIKRRAADKILWRGHERFMAYADKKATGVQTFDATLCSPFCIYLSLKK